jgi:uroporphyrin-III C-methyltransferase
MASLVTPKITLVGAGPGDEELITVKGLNAIKTAHVIFYDALANEALLNYASAQCLKIYVGKRNNNHAYPQEVINQLLVDYAQTHGHVVRLKGGDCFVFGRGMEEVLHAQVNNIPVTVVPGVTSAIAGPAAAHIPVTHRNVAQSFWVITATLQDGSLNPQVIEAAKTNTTVVLLMGLNKLPEIVATYLQAQQATLPIAIIQNATLANQKVLTGTINTIVAQQQQMQLQAPAVIVIGQVAALQNLQVV